MIRVAEPADPLEAQLLLGVLEEHGIRAVVQGEALWAARGELPFTPESAPSIWVNDETDAERARQILEEHKTPANPLHCSQCGTDLRGVSEPRCPKCGHPFRVVHTWTCPACKEVIGTQFTHCWSCGEEKPDRAETELLRSDREDIAPSAPSCPRCGGTGQIERPLLPLAFILCGGFLAFAAIFNLADASSVGVWSGELLVRRLLFAVTAVLCFYFARRVRRMSCACREQWMEE